jgi:hypothetical protein
VVSNQLAKSSLESDGRSPRIAEVIIFEVDCDPALYSKVNQALGLDPETRGGDWPKGLVTHIGAGTGDLVIVLEVWESRTDQESWMGKIGPALEQTGVPQQRRIEWLDLLGKFNR